LPLFALFQGEDPERFELVQRLALVQKRLIYGLSISKEITNKRERDETTGDRRVAVHSAPPASHSAAEMLFQLRQSQKQIKVINFLYHSISIIFHGFNSFFS